MKTPRQIINLYRKASRGTKLRGVVWYRQAHEYAIELSEMYGVDFAKVCAVISALSPANDWENNKREAKTILFAYVNRLRDELPRFRTYGTNVVKAWSILASDKSTPKEIAKGFFSQKTGPKTLAFYWNIVSPTEAKHVTIDRHMLTILGHDKITLTPKQYRLTAENLRAAALKIGLVPCELQAVLWCHHLRANKGKELRTNLLQSWEGEIFLPQNLQQK